MASRHQLYSPEDEIEVLEGTLALSDQIDRALRDPANPLAKMMDRARAEYVEALKGLIDADLISRDGILQARRQQAIAQRYRDLAQWIGEHLDAGVMVMESADSGEQLDPELIAELGTLYGRRNKPVPDA